MEAPASRFLLEAGASAQRVPGHEPWHEEAGESARP